MSFEEGLQDHSMFRADTSALTHSPQRLTRPCPMSSIFIYQQHVDLGERPLKLLHDSELSARLARQDWARFRQDRSMQPKCETRIVPVSPKGGLTDSRVSHQLVPLLVAGECKRAELSATSETSFLHLAGWGLGLRGVIHSGSRVNSDGALRRSYLWSLSQ